jgi:hypothetical protein
VDGAQDGSLRCCFMVLLYLMAKPANMGIDVDGLVRPLHHPMPYGHQTRG